MNGSMISYEGRCGLLVLKNVVMFIGMSTKQRILLPPKNKILDGCNPGNQSPRKHFSLLVLQATIVGIVCLVVHGEFVVHKVETV